MVNGQSHRASHAIQWDCEDLQLVRPRPLEGSPLAAMGLALPELFAEAGHLKALPTSNPVDAFGDGSIILHELSSKGVNIHQILQERA